MTTHPFVILDVFTERPLAGNQLAVFPDATGIAEELLQPFANEIHFSETVFVYPDPGRDAVRVRIFTPAAELPFAGHPVLGTAALLGVTGGRERVVVATGKGEVPVRLTLEGERRASGWMVQPLPKVAAFDDPRLLPALGVERSELPVEIYDLGIRHLYVTLADDAAVAALKPDFGVLAALGPVGVNCIAGNGTRWKSRMFAPELGVFEDPATGSAAGPLAAHVCRHGRAVFGTTIEITQGVEIGRPSRLLARVEGTAEEITRVEVGGTAIVVGRGELAGDLS